MAVVTVRPFGPIDLPTRRAIVANGLVHRDIALVIAPIDAALARTDKAREWPADGSPTGPTGTRAVLLVPILTVPQIAVDLRLPLSALTGTVATSIRSDGSYPRIGQLVFHDVDRDSPPAAFRIFEVDRPTPTGAILVDPILVDSNHRFWLDRIGP